MLDNANDVADFYIFTPTRSGNYTIRLCDETCESAVADDMTYLMIYDQNQTTIASTPIGTQARHEITADLSAGLAYYIEVNSYNAAAVNYEYALTVLD